MIASIAIAVGLNQLISVLFVLVVLGFVMWLFQRSVPIASPFKEVILFLVVLAVVIWLLGF